MLPQPILGESLQIEPVDKLGWRERVVWTTSARHSAADCDRFQLPRSGSARYLAT